MAPNIDREAEHIKEKARKDLLGLLENVRQAQLSLSHPQKHSC